MTHPPIRRRRVSVALAASAAALAACPAFADYRYEVFDFPGGANTYAFGLNEHGDVVGSSEMAGGGPGEAFSRIGGVWRAIPGPLGLGSGAADIDSAGNIVGQYTTPGNGLQGYLLPPAGPIRTDGPPGASQWITMGLNDLGQQSGILQGGRGFVWDGQVLTTYGAPGGDATATWIRNVNASGQMVGNYFTGPIPGTWTAFFYDQNGFSTLVHPDALETSAYGINDSGEIVGRYNTLANVTVGYVRHADGSFEDLLPPGALSATPEDINNSGQVVGYFFDGTSSHGFLATPVPEPAAGWLLLAGLGTIGWAALRQRPRGARFTAAPRQHPAAGPVPRTAA